jgi:integrase
LQELLRLKLKLRGGIKKKRSIPVAACNALVANLHGVHKLIFVWSLATGLRIGGLLNVKLVDFEQLSSEISDRFVFVLSKGGKVVHAYVPRLVIERTSRYVEIDRVLSLGRKIKSGRPPEALFLNSAGAPVSYSCYYSAFKRASSAIKIKANPHQARNTFATVVERRISTSPAFKNLDSVKIMQGLLSHASSETTEGYLDSIVSNNSDVLAMLEDMFGDIAGGV